jgi:hypothetical protein
MFDGKVVGERGADASESDLGLLMAGIEDNKIAVEGDVQ